MGPSSQGNNIAVERYLGSCLISSASRKPKKPPDDCNNLLIKQRQQQQQQQHYHHHHHQQRHNNNYVVSPEYSNGWAGMPLISMANSRRVNTSGINKKQQQPQQNHVELQQQTHHHHQQQQQQNERSPLSRLAIHTQGAPLILSGNYGRKNGKTNTPAPLRIVLPRHPRVKEPPSTPSSPPASGSDSLSVASDESSGHSENSLPRIIKPRKRRKKERKPSLSTPENDTSSVTNPSIVTLQPYVPLCYEFDKFRQRSNNNNTKINNGTIKITDKVIGPPSNKDNSMRNVITPPIFDEIEEEIPSSTVCQCRYCDPSGLIWDFDRSCYSPSLTSPSSMPPRLSSLPILRPSSGEYPWFISHESLRRSHSEPSNILPLLPVQRNNNNHFIPQNNIPTESLSSSSSTSKPIQELEVTSEIVTSLNGHRDIEIKFFLPSSLNAELSSTSNREE